MKKILFFLLFYLVGTSCCLRADITLNSSETNPGSTSGSLIIGTTNISNITVVYTNSTWSNSGTFIGNTNTSGDNQLLVYGNTFTVSGDTGLYVGSTSDGNMMQVNGATGTVTAPMTVGNFANSNSLVVNNGSLMNFSQNIVLGNSGSYNTFTLASGGIANIAGSVTIGNVTIGNTAGSTGNIFSLTNNANLDVSENFIVGYYSGNNSFVLADNSRATLSNNFIMGTNTGSINNTTVINNSTLNVLGSTYVGYFGPNNSLSITNGSIFNVSDLYIGYYDQLNRVDVDSSIINISGSAYVGSLGSENILNILHGSTGTITGSLYIGGSTNGDGGNNNSALISSSTVNVYGDIDIGYYYGSQNSLTISNGAQIMASTINIGVNASPYGNTENTLLVTDYGVVATTYLNIGTSSSSSNNNVIITGSSSLNVSSVLNIGQNGSGNLLMVSNQGALLATTINIGASDTSFNNSLIVTGSNSTCSPVYFNVGTSGSGNFVTIINEGQVNNIKGLNIAVNSSASNNAVFVNGAGSVLTENNTDYYYFIVGNAGSYNELVITNEGSVSSSYGVIGYATGANNNEAIVTGTNSTWTNANDLYVGLSGGFNTLNISNGGSVFITATTNGTVPYGNTYIGLASSGNSLFVTGIGSLLSNSAGLYVGNIGSNNSLVVSNGSKVIDNEVLTTNNGVVTTNYAAYIGWASGVAGSTATVTGAGSLWTNNGDLAIGYGSYGNIMIISDGGTVFDTNAYIGYLSTSSNNSVIVTGNGSLWTNAGDIYLGYGGSNNNLLVTNGGTVVANNTYILGGTNNNSLITGSNSLMSNTGVIMIGNSTSSGLMTISNGATVIADQGIFITNGTLNSYGDNSLSNTVTAGGGSNVARLFVEGNLTMPTFVWKTNGFVAMQMGSGTLSVTDITTSSGGGGFDFSGTSLNNNNNLLITAQNGVGSANSYYARGMSGITFATNGTNIFSCIETNANFVTSVGIYQTNTIQTLTCTYNGNGVTSTITTNGNWITPVSNGVITLTNNTTLINNGLQSGNTLLIASGSTLAGAGTNTFIGTNNSGTIVNDGTISPGSYGVPATMTLESSLYSGDSSMIAITLAGTRPEEYAHLDIIGNLVAKGTLAISFGKDSNGKRYIPCYGDCFLNITKISHAASGDFDIFSAPKDYRLRPGYVVNGTEYETRPNGYTAINGLLAPAVYTLLARGQNQINVASALNTFIPPTNTLIPLSHRLPTLDERLVSFELDHLRASEYSSAFNQIMPTLYQSLSTIAFNVANGQDNELMQRLGALRIAGGSFTMSGFADNTAFLQEAPQKQTINNNDILLPGVDKHWGVFIDGNGIFAQANSGNMLPNYNTESGGVTTGLTYEWNNHVSTGLYAGYEGGYTKYNANANAGAGSLVDNAARFGLFGTYGQPDGIGFYVNTLLGGGYNCYTMQRSISFASLDRTATGMPQAGELDTMLALGYDQKRGPWTFGPTMGLQYTYFGVNPFSENGAKSLDLSTSGWNTSSMIYSLGSHAAYTWHANKSLMIIPQLSLGWQYEFLQNPYAINSTLGSATFSNWTSAPQRNSLFTGVGVTLELSKKWDLSFFYNALAGNPDMISQNIFLSAGTRF